MSARSTAAVAAIIGLTAIGTAPRPAAAAQDGRIEEAVARTTDGFVRFSFEPREGVCGDGESIQVRGDRDRDAGEGCDCVCDEGPVRVDLGVRAGEVHDLTADVGGEPRNRTNLIDLGEMPPQAAADYLLSLAAVAPADVGRDAVFPATIARDVETWPRLLELARADDVPQATRETAVFWLGQQAGARATEGLETVIHDEQELEVREAAVFALSQREDDASIEALIRVARSHPEPELRKNALFWLGQRDDDPRVLALFEELLLSSP